MNCTCKAPWLVPDQIVKKHIPTCSCTIVAWPVSCMIFGSSSEARSAVEFSKQLVLIGGFTLREGTFQASSALDSSSDLSKSRRKLGQESTLSTTEID